jgi:C1A family cysteine protease
MRTQKRKRKAKFSFFFALLLVSCGQHGFDDFLECSDIECFLEGGTSIISITGWLENKEDPGNVPQDIMLSNFSENNSGNSFPSYVSLEDKFPPIQSQGQYGTCVAWATGYNMKTALNAIEKGWGSTELAKAENQTSPKDLFFNLNNADKGSNCNGTTFEAALDVLISKGATSLKSVPYSNMGNCSGSSIGDENNKLANYRKIAYNYALYSNTNRTESEGMTLDNFKGYLAQGRPIIFGGRVGDRFTKWKGASVISSDTYNDPGGHGMALVGYDDSKSAFRVRNSWGTNWGDNGSIWVDYDFFFKSFCKYAFVAQNPSPEVKGEIKEDNLLTGYDLLAAFAEDFPDPDDNSPRARAFSYDVYNSGTKTILASQRWTVLYMYYNATDANDFEIIYEDYYTNEFGRLGEYGSYIQSEALVGGYWNHANVLPGKKAGEAEWGDEGFYISYEMPRITGKYYLLAFADAYDVIKESNEDNNFYFIGTNGGKPLEFASGVMQNKPANVAAKILAKETSGNKIPRALAKSVQEIGGSLNAYTPEEIKTLVLRGKKNGILAKKVAEYRASGTGAVKKHRLAND